MRDRRYRYATPGFISHMHRVIVQSQESPPGSRRYAIIVTMIVRIEDSIIILPKGQRPLHSIIRRRPQSGRVVACRPHRERTMPRNIATQVEKNNNPQNMEYHSPSIADTDPWHTGACFGHIRLNRSRWGAGVGVGESRKESGVWHQLKPARVRGPRAPFRVILGDAKFQWFERSERVESGFKRFPTFSNISRQFQTCTTVFEHVDGFGNDWTCVKRFEKVWKVLDPDSNTSDLSNPQDFQPFRVFRIARWKS